MAEVLLQLDFRPSPNYPTVRCPEPRPKKAGFRICVNFRFTSIFGCAITIRQQEMPNMWTETIPGKAWKFQGKSGDYSVAKINDVGGRRNYSTRRAQTLNDLVGYSGTLDQAKERAESDDARKAATRIVEA
jgi:hypothetical protein